MGINIEMISHNSVVYGGIKSREKKKNIQNLRNLKSNEVRKKEHIKRIVMNYIYIVQNDGEKEEISRKTNKTFWGFQIKIYILYLYIYIHM